MKAAAAVLLAAVTIPLAGYSAARLARQARPSAATAHAAARQATPARPGPPGVLGGGTQALAAGQVAYVVCYQHPTPPLEGVNYGPYVVIRGYAEGTPCAVGGGCTVSMGPYYDLATANAVAAMTTCP